jgi:hypothetical protein
VVFNIRDNGGRRSGIDRRHFNYSDHFPERRIGTDRRTGLDRRTGVERREEVVIIDIRDRRNSTDRRSGADRRDFMIL